MAEILFLLLVLLGFSLVFGVVVATVVMVPPALYAYFKGHWHESPNPHAIRHAPRMAMSSSKVTSDSLPRPLYIWQPHRPHRPSSRSAAA